MKRETCRFQKTEIGFKAHHIYNALELYGMSDHINVLYESPSEVMLDGETKEGIRFYIVVKEDDLTLLLKYGDLKEVSVFKHPQQVLRHLMIKQEEVKGKEVK